MLVFFTSLSLNGISGQIFGSISSFLSNKWLWVGLGRSGIWFVAKSGIGFWIWIWSARHCEMGQKVTYSFYSWKITLTDLITLLLLMQKWIGLFFRKNPLLLKLPLKKLEPWFILWSIILLRLLFLYKSTIQPCVKYCCHVWAGASSCYLELLHKLQKRI